MDKLELAWAAGFFDGEGCTCNGKTPGGRLQFRISVGQTDIRPLERFLAAVGAGTINGPYYAGVKNRKPRWDWIARGQDGMAVCEKLFPYLSEPKQEQMLAAIQANTDNLNERRITNPNGLSVAQRSVTHG